MKKLIVVVCLMMGLAMGSTAQTTKSETKLTTTPAQKVHNTFSKNKKYKGYKTKTKHANGRKHVKKVNTTTGEIKVKNKD